MKTISSYFGNMRAVPGTNLPSFKKGLMKTISFIVFNLYGVTFYKGINFNENIK